MRIFVRVVISAVAGLFLMWPLGYVYGLLNWPTFHSWGLVHGSFFSAWPTLSIFVFLSLGYARPFPKIEDTPVLMVGLAWGLLLTGFSGIGTYPGTSTAYSFLAVTTAILAVLSFFAKHSFRLLLVMMVPIVLFNMQFLLGLTLLPPEVMLNYALGTLHNIKFPAIFAVIGWGAGSFDRIVLKRTAAARQAHIAAMRRRACSLV